MLIEPKSIKYNPTSSEWNVLKLEGKDEYTFKTDHLKIEERVTNQENEKKYKYRIIFCSTNEERPFGESKNILENGNEYFVVGICSKSKEIEEDFYALLKKYPKYSKASVLMKTNFPEKKIEESKNKQIVTIINKALVSMVKRISNKVFILQS
jgi:hypothetical protein